MRAGSEQPRLIKALLKADIKFRHDLEPLNAPWAVAWRYSIHGSWTDAKKRVQKWEASRLFQRAALSVFAEHFLETTELVLRHEHLSPDHRHECVEKVCKIIADCDKLLVPLDLQLRVRVWNLACSSDSQVNKNGIR